MMICGFKLLALNSKTKGIRDVCKLHISLLFF
jgi:hypothetical protein